MALWETIKSSLMVPIEDLFTNSFQDPKTTTQMKVGKHFPPTRASGFRVEGFGFLF